MRNMIRYDQWGGADLCVGDWTPVTLPRLQPFCIVLRQIHTDADAVNVKINRQAMLAAWEQEEPGV